MATAAQDKSDLQCRKPIACQAALDMAECQSLAPKTKPLPLQKRASSIFPQVAEPFSSSNSPG
jgi:hypothetical protein